MDSLDGCIFGWTLTPHFENIMENLYGVQAMAHHTGLILKWNKYDIWGTIIAHYGIEGNPIVLVETLGDAVERAGINTIYINDKYKASFEHSPYFIDDDGVHLGIELEEYEITHPVYDIWYSNCQHFVSHFTGNVVVESDIRPILERALATSIRYLLFGRKDKVSQVFGEVLNIYNSYRTVGVCNWNPDLTIYVK